MEHVYALGDLLAEEALGLSLVTGGCEALSRRVSGAHAIEVDHPARWLAPDWVMLTTGVALRRHPETQRRLIRELEAARVSALGFGVEVNFKRIPAALLDEAERREYPVFTIPLETPFREVISAVHRSLVGGEMRIYQRLSSIQRYLLDALTHDDPQGTLLERLAVLLDATVILFGSDGRPLASTGEAPTVAVWRHVEQSRDMFITEFEAGGWHAVAAPVRRSAESASRWLVVAARRPGFSMRLAKVSVQAATALLAAMARLDELARERELALRSALLDDLLAASSRGDSRALAMHAASLGIDLTLPAYVVVVESGRDALTDIDGFRAGLRADLTRQRLPHLISRRPSAVIALVQQTSAELRDLLRDLSARYGESLVGIGRPVHEMSSVHLSLRDAQVVIAYLRRHPRVPEPVATITELDPATLLVSEIPPDRIRACVDEYLAPVHASRDLYQTLVAFFTHNFSMEATARALHVHPNTLRYRLARVERTIGQSLKQPSTIAALHIALLAENEARASLSGPGGVMLNSSAGAAGGNEDYR